MQYSAGTGHSACMLAKGLTVLCYVRMLEHIFMHKNFIFLSFASTRGLLLDFYQSSSPVLMLTSRPVGVY